MRKGDFLVQEVAIRGDTRDAEQRAGEIRSMLRNAIRIADRGDIELATGDYILTRLTLDNADDVGEVLLFIPYELKVIPR